MELETTQWMHILTVEMPAVMENKLNIWSGQKGTWFNFFMKDVSVSNDRQALLLRKLERGAGEAMSRSI